jgi:chemotaxis protein methyltransferase CheR
MVMPMPEADPIDQEFPFTNADFERVRKLIYGHAGISLNDGKKAMVYSRLSRRLRETSRRSFTEYLDALERSSGDTSATEWQEFVNCLTTNLTSFFREEHHFHALADELKAFVGKPLRIWCCAASTGEEPYSLAMICHEALRGMQQVQLICSDIDTNVLATAKRGVYQTDARGLSAQRLREFFMRGTGANAGSIRFKPELSRNMDFRVVNLMHSNWNLGEPFHMVFCRNVMIYFDAPTQRKVLERIHKVIQPGGLLFVGHSENFTESKDLFRLRGKTIYERV